ncbi:hypothetical protein Taro_008773 [Colocasia esculenta]|uniref:Uncharacterized protein n=1 Tax=Colocasia esculenta TaxID=4460 RepID=A0A843TY83_COLES|nr:hypothetical protein [Colocasia esculenta]
MLRIGSRSIPSLYLGAFCWKSAAAMAYAAAPLRHWPRAAAAAATATTRPRHVLFACSGASPAAVAASFSSSSFLRAAYDSHFFSLLSTPSPPRRRGYHLRQQRPFSSSTPLFVRAAGLRTQGLRLPGPSQAEDRVSGEESDSGSDPDSPKKSRNERKREARRAVKWGMDLANFSPPQIKRILRVACLEKEVFDAIMLVKRLGPDVREGRRRQFNYIGRLLRKVQPELMDTLIQASKDGDHSKLQALSGPETLAVEDYYEEEEETDLEEVSQHYVDIARRWFDGLVYKDTSITKEIYSIHNVEFDRQELRKLVRKVQTIEECHLVEENGGAALTRAKQSLNRFLCTIAKRSLSQ